MIVIWPEIFLTGIEPTKTKNHPNRKAILCADGLAGWALCQSGNKPPKNFGNGMVIISSVIGIENSLPETLMKYTETLNV